MLLALHTRPPRPDPFYPHLLPPNSTKLERAFSRTTGHLTALPVEISRVFNWETCPAPLLPWLAHEHSVDLWDEDWSEARKREIIRDSVEMHRLKGTLAGARWYLRFVDASIVRAIVPPQTPHWAPDDPASQAAWEATLPQVRIYPRREPGYGDGFYHDDDFYDDAAPKFGGYYEEDRAHEDGGERITFFDPASSEETEIDWLGHINPHYRVHTELGLPGTAEPDHFYFDDDCYDYSHLVDEREAHSSIVSLPPMPPDEIVNGWYRVTNSVADYISTDGSAGYGPFYYGEGIFDDGVDNVMDGDYYDENDAPYEVYRRWYIFSPDASPGDPDGWDYYGDFRYGMSPHQAEMWIDIPETAPGDVAYDEVDAFYCDTDLSRFEQVAHAINLSRAERDQILIDTELRRPIRFGDRRLAGDRIKFGEYIARPN